MADLLTFDYASAVSGLMGLGSILAIILIALLLAAALWYSGLLKSRKMRFTLFLNEPRANGTFRTLIAKGDYLPKDNDKFEVYYGPFDVVINQLSPKGECIGPDNQIHGYCKQRSDITWIPWNKINLDATQLSLEPLLDPGIRITLLTLLKEAHHRFQEQDKWKQYLPLMSIVVAALIIVLPIMLGLGQIADKLGITAGAMNGASAALTQAVNALQNSSTTAIPVKPGFPLG